MFAALNTFKTLGGETYATWNPADKHAYVTLSNSNKTATGSVGAGGVVSVRATQSKSAGKWYWECVTGYFDMGHGLWLGLASSGMVLSLYPLGSAGAADSYGYDTKLGGFAHNGTTVFMGAALATGNVVGFAWDVGAGTLAVYANNSLQGTATGVATGLYPAASVWWTSGVSSATTAHFSAADLTYAPPAGFNAGLYI